MRPMPEGESRCRSENLKYPRVYFEGPAVTGGGVRQELDPEHEGVVAQTYVKNERGDYVVNTVSLRAGPTVSLRGGAMADEVAVVLARYETTVFTWRGWNSGRLTPKHEERHATIDEARYRHERVVDDVEAERLP
jgi:hypothetical protein